MLQTNSTNPFLNPSVAAPKVAPFVPPKPNPNAGNPYGIQPYSPMPKVGQVAKSPQTAAVSNSLPSSQAKPVVTQPGSQPVNQTGTGQTASTGNTGYIGNPYALQSYQSLQDMGTQESPEVKSARDELQRYQQAYGNANAGIAMGGQDFNYAQGTEQNIANQYQQGLGARQSALSSALSSQGQKISALSGAAGLTSPTSAFGIPFSNISGSTILNTGSNGSSPNLNSLAAWGSNINYSGTAATAANNNDIDISSARSQGQALQNLLQSTPDYNTNPVNLWNTIVQNIQGNVSNPKYPQIQAAVKNILNQYGQVLGVDPTTLLIQGAQAPSLQAFLANLDDLANRRNTEIRNKASGVSGNVQSPFGGGSTAPQGGLTWDNI